MTRVSEGGGPGAAAVEVLLAQPRVQVAHRLGSGLLIEAELRRAGRRDLVPFVLGHARGPGGDLVLEHAHAAASSVTVTGGGGYLFLSDRRAGDEAAPGCGGRSLWLHRPQAPREPRLVLGAPRGVVSYAAAGAAAVAAVWVRAGAASLAEDRELRAADAPDGDTVTLVRGDLWPQSQYHTPGEVLRVLRVGLSGGACGPGAAELLALPLGEDVRLTGELALTPDGLRCAAGVARFLRGGHRRHGLLVFALSDPAGARAVWAQDDDLSEPVAAPDGAWFACTAERIARPGLGPRQEAVLVAADGSAVVRVAPRHADWLRPQAWSAADTLLCTGQEAGRRHLWRVRTGDGAAERVEAGGSVQAVTVSGGELLVVRSRIDLPPEVVSLPADAAGAGSGAGTRPSVPALVAAPAAAATPAGRMERRDYRAPDGSTWHSWLCLPDSDPGHELPVLVWCHGGPLLSWTDWSWRWNPWPFVAEGYAVLMPDPPLSLGYGQQAVERGWGRWTSEVAAVAAAQVADALAHPLLDAGRVAVMGGSFGGYLSLALATLLPSVRLAVSHAGWADFAAVARVCDLHWHWLREYGAVDEAAAYRRESLPLEAIGSATRVLLSHGCLDTHVPAGESRAIYRSLDGRGVDVELMLLPDEGHSIRKPANAAAWFRWVLEACHAVLGSPSLVKGSRSR
ncbi:S9 family peptidase [Streptomyces incarnatus]|uniref:S9 family peptidase n=1 Tax=Streptomyces incarnatus TaxID=665007 RepID=UPI000A9F45C1|nr:prolyl oligopeptidase family serine peptidase [Streptomyces incarnatus]